MLARRQINVQRENLITMCRISVKALLDQACLYTQVDDDCEEFINFCAVFEQLVSHRLSPNQKKVWRLPGPGTPRHFWDVLLDVQARSRRLDSTIYFKSCIPNINAIESFKSPTAKLRAFIRVALMEKRLSDYIMWVLDHQDMLRLHYQEGAVMLSEQASVLCGDLIGLNAIDFNFCLKGNENEFLGPLEISYSNFLRYKQSPASRDSDEIEMLRLNSGEDEDEEDNIKGHAKGEGQTMRRSSHLEVIVNDTLRLRQLERDFKSIKEQKDYLEELARLRERQVMEANARLDALRSEVTQQHQEWDNERRTMDSCILELQDDITKLYKQNEKQRFQLASYRQFKEKLSSKEVQLEDMSKSKDSSSHHLTIPQSSTLPASGHQRQHSQDRRSLLSSGSVNLREDTQSMVPLTGSLADVDFAMLDSAGPKDCMQNMTETRGMRDSQSSDIELAEPAVFIKALDAEDHHLQLTSEANTSNNSAAIMMESFVLTEDKSEIEMAVLQALVSHGDGGNIVDVDIAACTSSPQLVAVDHNDGDDSVNDNAAGVVDEAVEYDDYLAVDEINNGIVSEMDECSSDHTGAQEDAAGGSDTSCHSEFSEPEQLNLTPEYTESDKDEDHRPSELSEELGEGSAEAVQSEQTIEESNTTATGDPETATYEPLDLGLAPEPEDLGLTSDPELIDHTNTSSGSSDAAWDMVSDSENTVTADEREDEEELDQL